jgi:hypothetical protein
MGMRVAEEEEVRPLRDEAAEDRFVKRHERTEVYDA